MQRILSQWLWPSIAGIAIAVLVLEHTGWRDTVLQPSQQVTSYATAVAKATPSVVNIYTAKVVNEATPPGTNRFNQLNRGYNQQRVERSLGSGVILSEDGIILTNRHVIADADAIQVLLNDNRNARAELLGADPATDLAVLKNDLDRF